MVKIINKFDMLIEDIKILFNYFFDGKFVFFAMFLLSIEYIWFTEKNKKISNFFTIYIIFILLIIWNPICIWILQKFINFASMYRVYYMLPMTLTIAVALTKIISKLKNKYFKLGSILAVFIVLCFVSNGFLFNNSNTIKTNNWYKLPDETIAVAEIIKQDDTYSEKRAMVPYGMSSQIQQVYNDIYLPYVRLVYNISNEKGKPSTSDTDDASTFEPVVNLNNGNVDYLGMYANQNDLNYIVVNKSVVLNNNMENIGFERYKETNEHIVYRKMK